MADVLSSITKKDLLDFSQNYSISRNYDGDTEFPDVKTENLEAEYYRLADTIQLPTAAFVHALDTEAHIGSRPTIEKVNLEKLLLKEKLNQSERIQLLKSNGVTGTESLLRYVFDDIRITAERVKTRSEIAKMEVLATGKMTIKENGLDMIIDYGVPSDNYFSLDWDDTDHDILSDIQGMVDIASDMGKVPTKAKTSSAILMKIRKNLAVQKAIGGIYMQGVMPGIRQINALFMDLFGFSITVNNAAYQYETASGEMKSKKFFEADKFVLYTTNIRGGVGTGLWGVTAEELAYGPWTSKSAKQFITITQWATPDPVATWTKASGIFIPVLPDSKGLFIATVSHETLGNLTLTSAPGTESGTTKVTVSPALTAGNSYKVKSGANVTVPAVNQLISGGYANWDGTADITAVTGNKVVVVEVDADNRAKKAGIATVVAKA